jgi:site-specific DNA recombinase
VHEEGLEPVEKAVVAAISGFDELWGSLFLAEQVRIVQFVMERVTVGSVGVAVDLRSHGIGAIIREMFAPVRMEELHDQ